MTESLIVIEQLPVIAEQLKAVKQKWADIAEQAQTMVATEDTIQAVKTMRADMRKEFDAYERQRIATKKQYLAPWEQIEAAYKDCVKDSFTAADAALKNTVDGFETELKKHAETELRIYFDELCEREKLGFLTFEQAMNLGGLKISLADAKSTGKKALRKALKEVVERVDAACDQIGQMEDDAEIMVEYKKCFDVGHAVAIVQGRKRRIIAEQEAAEARKQAKEREEAAVASVPVWTAPVQSDAILGATDDVYDVTFTCYGITREQARKIKEFLEKEGINYGK